MYSKLYIEIILVLKNIDVIGWVLYIQHSLIDAAKIYFPKLYTYIYMHAERQLQMIS